MKVAVIGGTGVFGSRLVRLLCRDGHAVVAVGRGAAALRALAAETGAVPLVLDRAGDLSPLWEATPEAVVDAAGPFHAYGGDPWRLARACIARRIAYLDLADDAAFCAGIAALDAEARAAGVVALSGVSSVPCLSSAVVTALTVDLDEVDLIRSAILPGNRAPRGRSVMESILHQAGTPFAQVLDGRPEPVRSWSDPHDCELAPGDVRRGYVIEVPDQRLFPAHFGARTVEFRAGMELGVMNRGLAVLSRLRGWLRFAVPRWAVGMVRAVSVGLLPFGTDTGGMVVEVTGRRGAGWVRRRWILVAAAGDGPFVPATAARAILRDLASVAPGARPAVEIVALDRAEAAMADLRVRFRREEVAVVPLFPRTLGDAFADLAPEVRTTHDHAGPRRFRGRAEVVRGSGALAWLIAAAFRFPPSDADVPVEVIKRPVGDGEEWERRFGARRFRSHLSRPRLEGSGSLIERFGPFSFRIALVPDNGALNWHVKGGWVFGVPLPRWALPAAEARESVAGGRFRFDVTIRAPFGGGLVVAYRGWLAGSG